MGRKLLGGIVAVGVAVTLSLLGAPANAAGIQLYDGTNYSGFLIDVGTGTSYVGAAADNRTTSLKVGSGANYAVLYQFRDFGGCYTGRFYIGWYDLADASGYASYGGCGQFNNRTSSVG